MAAVLALCGVVASGCGGPAQGSGNPADFAAGHTIRIVVGYAPGGGYDLHARLLARHLPRHIGATAAIVENMPGAGGLLAARHLASVAPRDGLSLGLLPPNSLVNSTPDGGDVVTRFALLGSPSAFAPVCVFRRQSGITTAQTWLASGPKPPRVGNTGVGATSHIVATLLQRAAGFPATLVSGYASSSEVLLALAAGEVDGFCSSWETLEDAVRQNGALIPVLRLSPAPIEGLESVPDALSLVRDPQARNLLTVGVYTMNLLGRVFVAPPGVSEARVARLRAAVAETFADPAFARDAAAAGIDLHPVEVAELNRAFDLVTGDDESVGAIRSLLDSH